MRLLTSNIPFLALAIVGGLKLRQPILLRAFRNSNGSTSAMRMTPTHSIGQIILKGFELETEAETDSRHCFADF